MKKSVNTLFSCEQCSLENEDEGYVSRHEKACIARHQEKVASGQLTIGQAIAKLEKLPEELCVIISAPGTEYEGFAPGNMDSYRGYYDQLSIAPDGGGETVKRLLVNLEGSIGSTYSGWKGGEYTMDKDTWIWISEVGVSSEIMLVDICLSPDGKVVHLVGKKA